MRAVPAGDLTPMVGEYIREQTGAQLTDKFQAMMVLDDNNDFIAGVTISNFRGTDCEISCAGESPMAWRPHVCKAIFTYIFEQLGCVRCTCITTKANKRTRQFLEHLGFELEGNLRRAYDGRRDALIYGLLASDCRYLGDLKHGQEERASDASSTGPGGDGSSPKHDEQRDGGSEREP